MNAAATLAPPPYVKSLLENLASFEKSVALARKAFDDHPGDDNRKRLARAYADRGFMKTNLGADREGLRDLLRSHSVHYEYGTHKESDFDKLLDAFRAWEQPRYDPAKGQPAVALPKPSPDWCPDAQLGEALRVYARDTLLSMKPEDRGVARTLADALVSAIRSFERALRNCETINDEDLEAGSVRKARAWIASHRAACFTHFYFLRRSALSDVRDDVSEKLYREAEAGFTTALEENADYNWALKFKAFLLVLRAGPRDHGRMSDFRRARNLLRMIDLKGAPEQTSLARSKSMLLSYDVGENWRRMHDAANDDDAAARRDGIEAAEKSVAASIQAVREDPEDFVAAYFGLASTWFLSMTDAADGYYKAALQPALNSAKIRAHNAFSQALAVLTGLEDLEQHLKNEQARAKDPNAQAQPTPDSIFQSLLRNNQLGLDWETRAIFIRDPLNQLLRTDGLDPKDPDVAQSPFLKQRAELRKRYEMPPGFADEALAKLQIV